MRFLCMSTARRGREGALWSGGCQAAVVWVLFVAELDERQQSATRVVAYFFSFEYSLGSIGRNWVLVLCC